MRMDLHLLIISNIKLTMNQKINKEIQILVNRYKYGDYNEVLNKCSHLLKKNPKNDFLWNLAGLCFQRIGNHYKAITSFQNAIENNSKNISAKNNLRNFL